MMAELEQIHNTLEELIGQIGEVQYERKLFKDTLAHILTGLKEGDDGKVYLSLTPEGAECWQKAVARM